MRPREIERDEMIAALGVEGVHVTPATLLRWHGAWLLPQPRREGQGRGKGSRSFYPVSAFYLAHFLGKYLEHRRNLDDAGWLAWMFGFPVTPFAREVLLEACESRMDAFDEMRRLLKSRHADALKRQMTSSKVRRRAADGFSALPPAQFFEALTALADANSGRWRRRRGNDVRTAAVGTALSHGISDTIEQAVQQGVLDRANPVTRALLSVELPDEVVAKTLSDFSSRQSTPVLMKWLEAASEDELEGFRNAALLYLDRSRTIAGMPDPLTMSPDGFLLFLQVRALRCESPSLWDMGIDAVLELSTDGDARSA